MIPLRIDAAAVEPVSVADLRAYLRFDSDDDGVEDELLQALITAVRASLEIETRRILVPGRYRIALAAWPPDGQVPLPLSPLVALLRAGFAEAGASPTSPLGWCASTSTRSRRGACWSIRPHPIPPSARS
jgi:uncharacterized phiE125 gp8 family phage protein